MDRAVDGREVADHRVAEQTLVPEGLLGASEGDDTGDSGPRTARVWRGGSDRLRVELQGENGDRVLVRNGDRVSAYDGTSNKLKIGENGEAAMADPFVYNKSNVDEFAKIF